ncbi:chorismate--pyruvate lyase family protein [Teredinibacter haidensis]|mgnify:CR=1 FL=1|uniref:chorismate--pyruvate lyase family protein n=1 Tax=Teredinibacter haidensis TaxID=2731755 RepID=UPI000948C7C6|nr:chorismate pyruvate-lyase family protein [Teredinibacter haidensis]
MTRLFTSTGYMEADDQSSTLPLHTLPPFLRVLLTTDGTVTKSLESFFWEPVKVKNCGQQYWQLETDAPVINRQAGDQVLRRTVQLVGEKSGTCYATAISLICTELLSEQLRSELEAGLVGVGELLRECGLETYREIVALGEGGKGESLADDDAIWRSYRIVMEHQPFIQITEFFPLSIYQ